MLHLLFQNQKQLSFSVFLSNLSSPLPHPPLQIFTVQLTLGEQVWEAEGTSIKKAQHCTASKALIESTLPRPPPRSPKIDTNSNPGKQSSVFAISFVDL